MKISPIIHSYIQNKNNNISSFKGNFVSSEYDTFLMNNFDAITRTREEAKKLFEESLSERMYAYYETTEAGAIFDFATRELSKISATQDYKRGTGILQINKPMDSETTLDSIEYYTIDGLSKTSELQPERIIYTTPYKTKNSINIHRTSNDTITIAQNIVETESSYSAEYEYTIKDGQIIRIRKNVFESNGTETVEKESFFNEGDLISIQLGITRQENGKIKVLKELKFDKDTNELVSVKNNAEPNYTSNNPNKPLQKIVKTFVDATRTGKKQ